MNTYIYVALALLFMCLIFNKNKWICGGFLIFLALTSATCSSVPDYVNYYNSYMSQDYSSGIEFAYQGLSRMAYILRFSYPVFRLILYIGGYVIFFETIQHYTFKAGMVCALYAVSIYWIDAAQTRSFVASMIFLYSLQFLLNDTVSSVYKYCMLILLAMMIHTSYIIAFGFIALRQIEKCWHSDRRKRAYIIAIVLVLCCVAYTGIIPMIANTLFRTEKVARWFTKKTRLGFLVPMLIQALGYIILCWFYKSFCKEGGLVKVTTGILDLEVKRQKVGYLYNIKKIYEWSFLIMPLYIFNVQFNRLFRPFAILVYIAYALICEMNWHRRGMLILMILFSVTIFMSEIYPIMEYLVAPLVTDNIFIYQDFSIFSKLN